MKIKIYNAGIAERIYIKKVLNAAHKHLNQPEKLEISLSFVGKDEIRELNKNYRDTDKVTDVLSFPLLNADCDKPVSLEENAVDVDQTTGRLGLGDVVICRDVAKEQAVEYGHSYKREVAFLALHGYLHLVGFDHIEENDREKMETVQDEILALAKIGRE